MDATLTIERAAHALDVQFKDFIDMSDITIGSEEEKKCHFLSRALAAKCIMSFANADAEGAAKSITDGQNDLGLDAIYFDNTTDTLYLVQAKWRQNGQRTVDLGDCHKFLDGVRTLYKADFQSANDKIKKRSAEIHGIVMRSEVRITLVIAYSSPHPLGDHVNNLIGQFLSEENNIGDTEVFTYQSFDLKRLSENLGEASSRNIKLAIGLSEWGTMPDPYRAYYGQVKLSDIVGWATYGKTLLDRNLRFYRGSTEVNDAMEGTLSGNPDRFWYFNNGITILCDKIVKKALNGKERDWGIFDCQGVSVVNGAQTVGVIWEKARKDPGYFSSSNAKVNVRLISLEDCPEGFDADVTRATNTQNEIKHRDFAALDEIQQNLAREMVLDGKRYTFKSGDDDPKGNEGCTIEESTIALACANPDVTLATLAKREVGSLWRDIKTSPYIDIFNERTTARDMWRAVLILRAVNTKLKNIDTRKFPRGETIAVHGNRFILQLVFQDPQIIDFRSPSISEEDLIKKAAALVEPVMEKVSQAIEKKHPNSYLQTLFKNASKCRELFTDEPFPDDTLFSRVQLAL